MSGRHRAPEAADRSRRGVVEIRRFQIAAVPGAPQRVATLALLAIGVVLRGWQYLANSSLWIDEAALARNIIDRPMAALVGPLDYAQVAPIGFLLIEKVLVVTLGTSEYVLRAFPLCCGLLALFVFRRVAERALSGWAVPFAVGLFGLGTPFIYFSSQLKQYSSDVAVALVLLLGAIVVRDHDVTPRRAWLFGLLGAGAVWVSQAAVFILIGLAIAFGVLVLRERDRATGRALLVTLVLWASSASAAAGLTLQSVTSTDAEYLRWFWADGFMPMPPRSAADTVWIFNKLTWAFGDFEAGMGRITGGLGYRWSAIFTVVMLMGLWSFWRSRRDVALFLMLPLAIVAALSAAQIYPFTARLFLFLTPGLLLATAAGAAHVLSVWPSRLQALTPVVIAVLGGAPIYAAASALPPFWLQHLRPVVAHLATRARADDRIYVYYAAGQAYHYYAARAGLSLERTVFGQCAAGDPRAYLRQLDTLRGEARLWVIVSHAQRNGQEAALLLEYLDRIGRRLDAIVVAGTNGRPIDAALGLLYDLSDPGRLASVTSATYPIVPGPLTAPPGPWGCHGVGLSETGRDPG
jgi:hypothetical protein